MIAHGSAEFGMRVLWLESRAPVVVLEAHDVVLAEILAVLDLDEDELSVASVRNSVGGVDGDVDRGARGNQYLVSIERDDASSLEKEPVL